MDKLRTWISILAMILFIGMIAAKSPYDSVWPDTPYGSFRFTPLRVMTQQPSIVITHRPYNTYYGAEYRNIYNLSWRNDISFTPHFGAGIDCSYSFERIDRYGIMSSIMAGGDAVNCVPNVEYSSVALNIHYRLSAQWRFISKIIYETASLNAPSPEVERGCYRTSWGCILGLEFYPLSCSDMHLFATCDGRLYNFTRRAEAMGQTDYTAYRFSVGLILFVPHL